MVVYWNISRYLVAKTPSKSSINIYYVCQIGVQIFTVSLFDYAVQAEKSFRNAEFAFVNLSIVRVYPNRDWISEFDDIFRLRLESIKIWILNFTETFCGISFVFIPVFFNLHICPQYFLKTCSAVIICRSGTTFQILSIERKVLSIFHLKI